MKVMDHMQKSNIPQTRKQAGFTDDEVTAAEQQYMIWMQAYHPRYARMLMLGTSTQGYRGAGWYRAFPYNLSTKVFRQAFAKYDLDGNGKLAREELPPLLENLNIQMRIFVSKFLVASEFIMAGGNLLWFTRLLSNLGIRAATMLRYESK